MSISGNIMNQNGIDKIYIYDEDGEYDISLKDLRDYLKNRRKLEKENMIEIVFEEPIEPDDIFRKLNDSQLIMNVKKLLSNAKKEGIEKYYSQNGFKYRHFNLRGLIFNNGIANENNRKIIRDICRKCYDFLHLNYPSKLDDFEKKKLDKFPKQEQETTVEEQKNILYSKTCIYKFKRGTLKGKLCGKESIVNQSYCNLCIGRMNVDFKLSGNVLEPRITS
jgi:hypothetical protein